MKLGQTLQGAANQSVKLGGAGKGHTCEVGQLVQPDDEGRSAGEPADDRLGDEVGQEAEAEGAKEQLKAAHHEGKEESQFDVAVRAGHRHCAQSSSDQKGVHGHWTHRQLARSPHERVDHLRDQGGIEAVDHRQSRNHGIGHALRDQHDAYGQPGRKVLEPISAAIEGHPMEGGKPTSHEDKVKERARPTA